MRRPRRRRTQCQPLEAIDRDERSVLRRSAIYLDRTLERFPELNRPTLEFLFWVLGEQARASWEHLGSLLADDERRQFLEEIAEGDDADDRARAVLRLLNKKPRALSLRWLSFARGALHERVRALSYRGKAQPERIMERMRRYLDLSQLEAEYCFFIYIIGNWPTLESYFESHLECARPSGRKYLAAALGVSAQELTRLAQGKIGRLSLFDQRHNWLSISDDFLPLFQDAPEGLFAQGMFRKVPRQVLPLEAHLVDPGQTEYLIALLSRRPDKHGTHVLLYGPPGTGKSSYAQGLARQLGGPAYEVVPKEDTRRVAQRTAILACLNMTNHGAGALVIVDEADGLLQTRSSWFGLPNDDGAEKGWLNFLLDRPGVRMIWICNDISGIDESVQRRFAFAVPFARFGRTQRLQLWQTVAKQHRVRNLLCPAELAALAAEFKVSAGVIDVAVRSAKQAAGRSRPHFLRAVRAALESHRTLQNGGQRLLDKQRVASYFRPEALHTDVELEQVTRRLRLVDGKLRSRAPGTAPLAAPLPAGLNLLFYGPPGTGKSELARYLAELLDREALVRRASDIQSKWVGETEQNIARAFAEAERDDALLILDEVDTFLFRRGMAQRSWEISSTNELLTQLERFCGIIVCTTNRLEGLDPAALRRFQLKVRFDYLQEQGKEALYRSLLAPLCTSPVQPQQLRTLAAIGPLAPGDFRVVRDRCAIDGAEHTELLAALGEEAALRARQQGGRKVGFGL